MPHRVIVGLPRLRLSGPDIFTERLIRGLRDRGHEARILLTEANSRLVAEDDAPPPPPADLPCDNLPAGPSDPWGQRWEALERYLEERAPCFYVMLHDWRNNSVAPRLSRRVRLVGLVQADSEHEMAQVARLGQFWDAIVTVSDPLQFKVASLLPHLSPRLLTIRNAVPALDAPPEKPADGTLRIAYSGELRKHQKRLDDMVEIARRLAAQAVDFRLTFFGDGPHRNHLETACRDLIDVGRVEFTGRLETSELLQRLADQHVFLLTSEFEGLSIALLEAMSRGCVPVVSRLSSQSLVIREGVNALTARVGDVERFSEQLRRLATDRALLARLSSAAFASIAAGGYQLPDMLESYTSLFDRLDSLGRRGGFSRQRGDVVLPPQTEAGIGILPGNCTHQAAYVNDHMRWPDGPVAVPSGRRTVASERFALEDHRVIVAASPGTISGVDVFSASLVRGLRDRGIDARLHGRMPPEEHVADLTADLPFDERDPSVEGGYLDWRSRWRVAAAHLERLAPCIYVPNYDADYSCIAPILSERVRVVGIGHSDDPWHYEHLCRIGHSCDAIVGVSEAISSHLKLIAPAFTPRIETIPYGVVMADRNGALPAVRSPDTGDRMRIMYTGRLVRTQKRAPDLVAIARSLRARGVPFEMVVVGDGDARSDMERAGHDLIRDRTLWFTGTQPNAGVFALLETSDVFLLPSAFEGLSVGMLEAMSRGVVPVVSEIRSGVPDVITPGANGLVAPVGDIEAFADRIEWLWKHPTDRARIGAAAADTIANDYRVERMIDRYVDLFRRVIADPVSRPGGPVVPPQHLRPELTWSRWASRVAADPAASLTRIARRFRQGIA